MTPMKWKESLLYPTTIEAGGGGDCMFHAVANCLSKWIGQKISMQDVRNELALSIDVECVDALIKEVADDHAAFVPRGGCNLNKVKFSALSGSRVNQMRRLAVSPGTRFQGTDVLLRQLVDHSSYFVKRSVGALTLNAFGPGFSGVMPPIVTHQRDHYIVLYCSNNAHWQMCEIKLPSGERRSVLSASEVRSIFQHL
jgi:hypothetical protein